MEAARIVDINRRLCDAWFIQQGIKDGPMPSMAGVTLADAIYAAGAVQQAGGIPNADGSTILICHVSSHIVPQVFARAVLAVS